MADEQTTGARVYGAADPDNRQPPGPEGIRGEGTDQDVKTVRHTLAAGGQAVEVEETSGVAAVEAAGTSGLARDTDG